MTPIRNFNALITHLTSNVGQPPCVAAVCPEDDATVEALAQALCYNVVKCRLYRVGTAALPARLRDYEAMCDVRECADADTAARTAVQDVREGRAEILFKGLINTDNLLRAVLNKEHGLLPPGNVLTHLTVMEAESYDKLLFFSDAAVIPFPTLDQRRAMVRYVTAACRSFGIESPAVALIHCSEKVSPKFPVTLDYETIKAEGAAGEFGPAEVDGPMDVKTACDSHAAHVKGLASKVCGRADALIFPDIEAGNAFYKTMTRFAGATAAGTLLGTTAPVVLPSRSDEPEAKFVSLALAALLAGR